MDSIPEAAASGRKDPRGVRSGRAARHFHWRGISIEYVIDHGRLVVGLDCLPRPYVRGGVVVATVLSPATSTKRGAVTHVANRGEIGHFRAANGCDGFSAVRW